ncbi:MAG: cytidine deaminase [Algoriphagus sp. 32-45-6]|nr:MAG: cytidine deaminase [Algoriphagus sp. 32-45-6]
MSKPDFDDIFMELAVNLAKRSHCIKKHVGAVLTKDTRIISIGYNGPPAGTHNCDVEFPEHGCARDSKGSCSLALHAEQNAILYAVKNNTSVEVDFLKKFGVNVERYSKAVEVVDPLI